MSFENVEVMLESLEDDKSLTALVLCDTSAWCYYFLSPSVAIKAFKFLPKLQASIWFVLGVRPDQRPNSLTEVLLFS